MTRLSTIMFWFSLIIAASIGLYRTSDRVAMLERQLRDTNQSIENEERSIHVLKAEWVYLANPDRLGTASKKFLSLRPTTTQQIATMDTLTEVLPTKEEQMGNVSVTSTPIANIRTSLVMPPRPVVLHTASAAKHKPAVASVVASNDVIPAPGHMLMEHTASAQPLPDSIGALLNRLDAR